MAKPIGTLEIELITNIARLQADMEKVKRAIGEVDTTTARAARAAHENLSGIGQGAGAGIAEFSREVARLKASLDPVWAATRTYKDEVRVLQSALREGAITLGQYVGQMKAAEGRLQAVRDQARGLVPAMRGATASAGQQRAGMQQLSFQIGDVAQQFALGTNPMIIFAQQGQQVVQALSLMRGGAGGLIGFLGGPWGAAIMGAATVAGLFAAKLFDSRDAANAAADSYADAASEARGLIGAMNALALNKKRMDLNKVTESRLFWETTTAGTGGSPSSRKELQRLKWKEVELRNLIAIAEKENDEIARMAQQSERQNRAATGGGGGAHRSSVNAKAHRDKADALSAEEKAYLDAVKAAKQYKAGLEDETAKIGKTAIEIKRMEVAAAAAKAPTAGLALEIVKTGEAWVVATQNDAAKNFLKNTVEPLELQVSLLGQSAKAQALANLEAERETVVLERGVEAWNRYHAAQSALIENEFATAELEDYLASLDRVVSLTEAAAQGMADAFGGVGEAIGKMASEMARYEADRTAGLLELIALEKAGKKGSKEYAAAQAGQKLREIDHYRTLAGTAKGLFKEHSAGYKAMAAAEKALAAIQLVNTVKSVAAGAAKIFSQLGVFAFPVVAAMIALMAGLGFSGGGASQVAPPSPEDLQAGAGTGTVLGDAAAKSESLSRALEIVAANSNKDLEYSNRMLAALRSIDSNIRALAGDVAQQISVAGSLFDTSKLRLGSSGSGGFLGIGASSTTRELYDAGLRLDSGTVAQIMADGISGSTYQIVQQIRKKSGFLGIGGGTRTTYETTTGSLDASITDSIRAVIGSLRNGLVEASAVIGLEGAEALLDNFRVELGTISFKGMTGQEIEEQLNAIFSKVGDQMAGALLPSLAEMQQVGEGLFETFIRVARQYQVVETELRAIGMSFGAVGLASVAARDHLVQLTGGLDSFVEKTQFFAANFLSEAERIAPVAAAVREEMARLGLAGIKTKDQFKTALLGIDLTTAAGRELYAAMLDVAPAFAKVADYVTAANKKIFDEFSRYAESLRKYRDTLFQGDQASGNAYARARQTFVETAQLAAQGDAAGLSGLEAAGRALLALSRDNASSLIEYQRDVGLVAGAVDEGIFAADTIADYAQLQVDAINNVTAVLGARIEEVAAQSAALAETQTKMLNLWTRYEGDGLTIKTDSDTPIQVQVVT